MNTHWNTGWSNRHSMALSLFFSTTYCGSSTFSRFGVRIPVKAIFCGVTPMTTHIDQSIELFKNILHWLTVAESWEKEKNRKNCLDWDSNSRPGKRGLWSGTGSATVCCRGKEGKRLWLPIASHSVPIGSWLFPRQRSCPEVHVYCWSLMLPSLVQIYSLMLDRPMGL